MKGGDIGSGMSAGSLCGGGRAKLRGGDFSAGLWGCLLLTFRPCTLIPASSTFDCVRGDIKSRLLAALLTGLGPLPLLCATLEVDELDSEGVWLAS